MTRPSLMNYQAAQTQAHAVEMNPTSVKKLKPKTGTEEVIQTNFRLPRSRWKKLQELSIDQRTSVQAILIHSLESEFAKRGLTF